MRKLKVVFFGTPDFALPIPVSLSKNFNLLAVVTNPDKKVGRKQVLTPTPVKKWAKENNIPVFTKEKLDGVLVSDLQNLEPDLFVVASFGKIIPKTFLDIPKYGVLNLHFSLLPKYRGASPMQAALINGDEVTGISIIKMDEKMDHGPVVYAEEFSLSPLDNFQTLSTKMFERSAEILPQIIPQFVENLIPAKPQEEASATYTKIIKKEDGFFDIDNPPEQEKLDRMIRAYYPWPTAWTRWQEKIVKFLPNQMIQIEGKKPVKLSAFLNGYPEFQVKKLKN